LDLSDHRIDQERDVLNSDLDDGAGVLGFRVEETDVDRVVSLADELEEVADLLGGRLRRHVGFVGDATQVSLGEIDQRLRFSADPLEYLGEEGMGTFVHGAHASTASEKHQIMPDWSRRAGSPRRYGLADDLRLDHHLGGKGPTDEACPLGLLDEPGGSVGGFGTGDDD